MEDFRGSSGRAVAGTRVCELHQVELRVKEHGGEMFSRHDTAKRQQRGFRRLAEVGRHDELLQQIQFDRWLGHSRERICFYFHVACLLLITLFDAPLSHRKRRTSTFALLILRVGISYKTGVLWEFGSVMRDAGCVEPGNAETRPLQVTGRDNSDAKGVNHTIPGQFPGPLPF